MPKLEKISSWLVSLFQSTLLSIFFFNYLLFRSCEILFLSYMGVFSKWSTEFSIVEDSIRFILVFLVVVELIKLIVGIAVRRMCFIFSSIISFILICVIYTLFNNKIGGEEGAIKEMYAINFITTKSFYIGKINSTSEIYGGDMAYSAVERVKGKLNKRFFIWDLKYRYGGGWVVVYDESGLVNVKDSNRRYLGRFCALSSGDLSFNCIVDSKEKKPFVFGAEPLSVTPLGGNFFLANLDFSNY